MVDTLEDLEDDVRRSHREILAEIDRLKNIGRMWRLTDDQINNSIRKSLEKPKTFLSTSLSLVSSLVRILFFIIVFAVVTYFVISCHNPTKRFFSRYIQDYIYPFMRLLRLGTLPLHSVLSTRWYQESCLLQNPFYRENQIDCWPCQNVRFIADLTEVNNFTETYYNYGIPFTAKDPRSKPVTFETLQRLYLNHASSLDKGTSRFISNSPDVNSPKELFESQVPTPFHSEWSIDKVAATHAVRKLFPRPLFIPRDTEVALQKFLFVDSSEAGAYVLPVTDFANVWFVQGDGHRLVILEPSSQCRKLCSTLSVVLQPSEILFYNWQYWRPVSLPVNMTKGLTISFMGSFY